MTSVEVKALSIKKSLIDGIRDAAGDTVALAASDRLTAAEGAGRTAFQILYWASTEIRAALEIATWRRLGVEIVRPALPEIDGAAATRLGPKRVTEHRLVPLTGNRILVADPLDPLVEDIVRQHLGSEWRLVANSANAVEETVPEVVRVIGQAQVTSAATRATANPASAPRIPGNDLSASDSAMSALAQEVLRQAVTVGASDIHIELTADGTRIRFRVDGMLRVNNSIQGATQGLVNRYKILAGMDVADSQGAHDGRFSYVDGKRRIDVRCVSLPTAYGESISLRLLDPTTTLNTTEELGFAPKVKDALSELASRSRGAVLVTGPTGSGKTTTLYAMLNLIGLERKIVSIEDPVEYLAPNVSQHQVAPLRDFTFPSALRSFLRADADVILVGEVRDSETARTLMEASFTGHLVLSSLHANTAVSAPMRLIEMGVDPYAISAGLSAVLNQRLLRQLCPKCQVKDDRQAGLWRAGVMGCNTCGNTGYSGRIAVGELMMVTPEVAAVIAERRTVPEVAAVVAKQEMVTIHEDAMRHVKAGATSLDEMWRVLGEETGL